MSDFSDFHVVAVVLDKEGKKIVLVDNLAYKGKPAGLGLPGGRSKEGDDASNEKSVRARLAAEIMEELRMRVRILDKISSEEKTGNEGGIFSRYLYLAVAIDDGDKNTVVVNDGVQETAGWDWYDPDQFPGVTYLSHRWMVKNNMENIGALLSHHGL
jgi:8-oxo-dGTP pyrophosphatase MutT (NUDIX family)